MSLFNQTADRPSDAAYTRPLTFEQFVATVARFSVAYDAAQRRGNRLFSDHYRYPEDWAECLAGYVLCEADLGPVRSLLYEASNAADLAQLPAIEPEPLPADRRMAPKEDFLGLFDRWATVYELGVLTAQERGVPIPETRDLAGWLENAHTLAVLESDLGLEGAAVFQAVTSRTLAKKRAALAQRKAVA